METKVSEKAKGDLAVNNLIYRQPKALSLAVNRTMKRQQFQKSSYLASEIARCDWNTGSDYVNCENSYLTFKVKLTGTTPTANWGSGSAINVIDRITVTSRSGTEIDRVERCNLIAKQRTRYEYGQDWIEKYGSMVGFGSTGRGTVDPVNITATESRWVIPLSLIAGCFSPVNGQLMPPHLASGLQIEISFADYRTALFQKGGTVTGYEISGISIMTDNTVLADSTQKALNTEAARTGLEYTFPRFYTTTTSVQSTAVNAQLHKAVSQAKSVHAVLLTQANILDVTADSLASEVWDVSEWGYRLGGLHYPSIPLKDDNVDGVESYFIAQTCHDKSRHGHSENAVSLDDFASYGFAQMSCCFEKDQSLNMSGMPVNSSRVAELNATLAGYTAPIEAVVYLEYTSVVRAYLDNAISSI